MQEARQFKGFNMMRALIAALLLAMLGQIPAVSAAGKVTLNFNATDISAVISAVSEMTGRNFVVDPRVKGKVTVISHRALNAKEVYQVFLSVLKVHGFAAIDGKNITKIVPEVNAKQDAISTGGSNIPNTDELITQVLEIKNVDAAQLVPILRPLVPQRGHLAAYPASNVLVISDSAANVRRLKKIVSNIDRATGDEIEVISLKHASASEVVRIIQQLTAKDAKQTKNNLVADNRSNSVLLGGNKAARVRLRALIAHLDTPVDDGGMTQVVYLRNAVAKDLVPVLTGVSKSVKKSQPKQVAAATAGQTEISIQADEHTNSLVITAAPDVFRSLRSVIRQLDVRRAQVLVEAVIAEVGTGVSNEFGVQWAADGGAGKAAGIVNFGGGVDFNQILAAGIASDNGADITPPTFGAGLNLALGKLTGSNRLAAIINALAGDSKSNVLSTPSLLTLDNEEAEIVVGQNVPFLVSNTANAVGTTSSVQREDVGLTLRITPQINEGDAIKMKVEQEVSSVTGTSTGVDIITNKRSIKTSVIVEDGQMIVLGGLMEERLSESEQRVPGLGDIPLLGWFFRYNNSELVKTNLMVFLQPTILKDAAIVAAHTGNKYNFIRAKQIGMKEEGFRLLDEEDTPILAENKHLFSLPAPYKGGIEDEKQMPRGNIDLPPTMMEVEVKQNEAGVGGKW